MASRAASRTVCRRGDRRVGPVGNGEELSWQRVGQLSSSVIVGPVGLRVHDGGVFEPQAGTCDLRFGSVPLHRRERSSRPRHHRNVSASLSQGYRFVSVFYTVFTICYDFLYYFGAAPVSQRNGRPYVSGPVLMPLVLRLRRLTTVRWA